MSWTIESNENDPSKFADAGNRYLIANGYMGVRGTLDEDGKDSLAAINLAGIYDKVGDGWREPLNAPNPLHTQTVINQTRLCQENAIKHVSRLDYRYGLYERESQWEIDGQKVEIKSQRFASMDNEHLLVSRYQIFLPKGLKASVLADIDTNIWEIYGPHYGFYEFSHRDNIEVCLASVQKSSSKVAVVRKIELNKDVPITWNNGFIYDLESDEDQWFNFTSFSSIYSTNDHVDPLMMAKADIEKNLDFDKCLELHKKKWDAIWSTGEVKIEGDEKANEALNYSLYHLNSIAPRNGKAMSIPARGLSGQTYKGAIFWDSEMFILDYFLYTQPEVAKSLVRYRIDTLDGALKKAKSYGYEGAFYAWESQEGGLDACSDYNVSCVFTGRPMRTYFKDKQVHISAAIASAIMRYVDVTGDTSVLVDGGAKTVIECALFYRSLLIAHKDSAYWEIHDCIGPDEYHERINNNAYTNKMAKNTFELAVKAIEILEAQNIDEYEQLKEEFESCASQIRPARVNDDGIIEQFDGYFDLEDCLVDTVAKRLLNEREYWGGAYGVASHTRVIKQADVITMLELFHHEYDKETLKKNWEFYEPYTEHGSSLSACMYSLVACRFGEPDKAYPFFLKSAQADLNGGGKQWAGLVYIGGTHPAAAGGAWMVMAKGFAGLDLVGDEVKVASRLPESIDRISFNVLIRGQQKAVTITKKDAKLEEINREI